MSQRLLHISICWSLCQVNKDLCSFWSPVMTWTSSLTFTFSLVQVHTPDTSKGSVLVLCQLPGMQREGLHCHAPALHNMQSTTHGAKAAIFSHVILQASGDAPLMSCHDMGLPLYQSATPLLPCICSVGLTLSTWMKCWALCLTSWTPAHCARILSSC